MAKFKVFASGVEVNGETILSVVDGMGIFKKQGYDILAKNGIKNPEKGKWYPQQAWLDAFKEIAETIGPKTLYAIGRKIPENARFPSNIKDVHSALQSIDVAYHMNHRGGEIGHYHYKKTGERSAEILTHNPYPADFDRGIITAMAEKYAPDGAKVEVIQKGTDKDEQVLYIVKW